MNCIDRTDQNGVASTLLHVRTWAAPRIWNWGQKIRAADRKKIFHVPPTFDPFGGTNIVNRVYWVVHELSNLCNRASIQRVHMPI